MKGSKAFESIIKTYLDRYASKDEMFAEKYRNPNKSIEECCGFIASQVANMGVNGVDDAEVFGLAVHYYDEQDVKVEKVNYQVVCNHPVELTEEEKAEAKANAIKEYQQKMYNEYANKNNKKKKEESTTSGAIQLSLFD